ncbi:MAG: hypothetical protein M0C28_41065 [Candidatus Moduliflexus flocculans]|nr:hypothetical protein [Candidatus Moduliflexus flocculans]
MITDSLRGGGHQDDHEDGQEEGELQERLDGHQAGRQVGVQDDGRGRLGRRHDRPARGRPRALTATRDDRPAGPQGVPPRACGTHR